MKKLDIANIIFLIPILMIILSLLLSIMFGCGMSSTDMSIQCKVTTVAESVLIILFNLSFIVFLTSFYWAIPAIIIAVISFRRDYKEIKSKKKPLKTLFKKVSFYSASIYLLVILLFISSFIFYMFF